MPFEVTARGGGLFLRGGSLGSSLGSSDLGLGGLLLECRLALEGGSFGSGSGLAILRASSCCWRCASALIASAPTDAPPLNKASKPLPTAYSPIGSLLFVLIVVARQRTLGTSAG